MHHALSRRRGDGGGEISSLGHMAPARKASTARYVVDDEKCSQRIVSARGAYADFIGRRRSPAPGEGLNFFYFRAGGYLLFF